LLPPNAPAAAWLTLPPPPVLPPPSPPPAPKLHKHHTTNAQAHIWQLDFALSPQALRDVNMALRVNEDVLRHAVVKRELKRLPDPRTLYHQLSRHAEQLRPPPRAGTLDFTHALAGSSTAGATPTAAAASAAAGE
jgi:hypothetical protein